MDYHIKLVSDDDNINNFLQMGRLLGYLENSTVKEKDKLAEVNYNVKIGFITEEEAKGLIEEFING